jgi:putative FmdB family regulatory protein
MPYYDYKCTECGKKFTVKQTFEEHGRKRVKCPKCSSQKAERVIGTVMAKTSKKS